MKALRIVCCAALLSLVLPGSVVVRSAVSPPVRVEQEAATCVALSGGSAGVRPHTEVIGLDHHGVPHTLHRGSNVRDGQQYSLFGECFPGDEFVSSRVYTADRGWDYRLAGADWEKATYLWIVQAAAIGLVGFATALFHGSRAALERAGVDVRRRAAA